MCAIGFYFWYMRAVQVVGSLHIVSPRSSSAAHISDVRGGKIGDKDTVKGPVDPADKNVYGGRASVIFLACKRVAVVRFSLPSSRMVR